MFLLCIFLQIRNCLGGACCSKHLWLVRCEFPKLTDLCRGQRVDIKGWKKLLSLWNVILGGFIYPWSKFCLFLYKMKKFLMRFASWVVTGQGHLSLFHLFSLLSLLLLFFIIFLWCIPQLLFNDWSALSAARLHFCPLTVESFVLFLSFFNNFFRPIYFVLSLGNNAEGNNLTFPSVKWQIKNKIYEIFVVLSLYFLNLKF